MPTYQYHCTACGHDKEAFQKITEAPLRQCPQCGNDTLARGPGGGIGLSFKGSGFYINDYATAPQPADTAAGGPTGGCCPCGKNKTACSDVE